MSITENISLWHEKPELRDIERLVADTLPEAVEYVGGLCEVQGYSYELVIPEKVKSEYDASPADRVTPFAEHATARLPHIGLAHPLILGFAEQVLDAAPIEIVELKLRSDAPPQRVVEKLSSILTLRPTKIELVKQEKLSRVWIHSVYWVGFEAAGLGNRLKHFLQDQNGRFLKETEDYLKRLNLKVGDFEIARHSRLPVSLSATVESGVSESLFVEEFKSEISRVQNEELTKAMTYYDRLESDLRKRIEQQTQKGSTEAVIESLKKKMERVFIEREIRLGNIRERFRAQFRIQPVGARILILPTYQCTFKPTAPSPASISVLYCPVLREFLAPHCPSCHQSVRALTLRGTHYLCPKCC